VSAARTTVFGLDVCADAPLALLQGASASATGRRLDIHVQRGEIPAADTLGGFELICDEVEVDGTLVYAIDAHPVAGYLLRGPSYGAHLLSSDGRQLTCTPGNAAEDAWQRLLIAQVLPFAAVLRGLEVFHASAVVIDRHAVAFAGPSRSGKTSVALELCRLGASFLADDVLSLERDGSTVVGHPGSPIAGVDHIEVERVRDDSEMGEFVGVSARERLVRMRPAAQPAPLDALFLLDRRLDGPVEPRFEPIVDAEPILAATFNFVLATPQRLQGLLETCALVARRRVERVSMGPAVDASRVGAAIRQRLGEPE
jgi:hypothetical protein